VHTKFLTDSVSFHQIATYDWLKELNIEALTGTILPVQRMLEHSTSFEKPKKQATENQGALSQNTRMYAQLKINLHESLQKHRKPAVNQKNPIAFKALITRNSEPHIYIADAAKSPQ